MINKNHFILYLQAERENEYTLANGMRRMRKQSVFYGDIEIDDELLNELTMSFNQDGKEVGRSTISGIVEATQEEHPEEESDEEDSDNDYDYRSNQVLWDLSSQIKDKKDRSSTSGSFHRTTGRHPTKKQSRRGNIASRVFAFSSLDNHCSCGHIYV